MPDGSANISSLGRAARAYAAAGFRVLPCRENDKPALVKDWPNLATTDHERIGAWWSQWPNANVGIIPGPEVGVVDIDIGKGGEETWQRLCKEHGAPPATFSVRTPSGGRHLYFAGAV